MMNKRVLLVVPLTLGIVACGDDDDGGGGSAEAWCDLANEVESQDAVFDQLDPTDPASIEEVFNSSVDLLDRAVDEAPDEIQADVEATADAFRGLRDSLAEADWNLLDVDTSAFESLESDLSEASDNISAYNERECGITSDDTTDGTAVEGTTGGDEGSDTESTTAEDEGAGGGIGTGEGTLRDQLIQQFVASGFTEAEANCIAENVDISDPDIASGDPTAMMNIFEECDIDIARLAEIGGG